MPGSPGGDAGKDEASDAGVASEAAYLQGRRVDVGASGKADGAGPGGCLGEHEIGTRRPAWKQHELGRLHDPFAGRLER